MMGTPKHFSTNKNMHQYLTDIDILVNFVEFSCMLFCPQCLSILPNYILPMHLFV